ncbi:MAG: undecaprenyldiphospho-muramoylpentapeptide beta-N-acetylglucosaminyltransferase [Alphaproteobacteria bacterium]
MTRPIVIAAGGTGGHTFPAQATAQALMARGHRVLLATDPRGAAFAAKVQGAELLPIRSATFSGRNPIRIAAASIEILRGVMQARAAFRREKPLAVVGFGGYPALPSMLAARLTGTPSILHEANALLGRVNRLVAKRVTKIAVAFPRTHLLPANAAAKTILVGNPVRPAIVEKATPYSPPGPEGPIHLLVFGGSQGARVMSDVVPAALALLPEGLRGRLRVVQQARGEDLERARAAYAALGVAAETADFFTDIPERMAGAHLTICRSGASSCAELTAMGRPALLVPYPFATDDHQSYNARVLADSGAAKMIPQPAFTADAVAREIEGLFADPARLAAMAAAAKALGRPDAAEALADAIEALGR